MAWQITNDEELQRTLDIIAKLKTLLAENEANVETGGSASLDDRTKAFWKGIFTENFEVDIETFQHEVDAYLARRPQAVSK